MSSVNFTFEENEFVYTVTGDGTVGLGNLSINEQTKNAIAIGKTCPENVIIPSTVKNGQYTVTSILRRALHRCPIYSIKLPNTITIIKIRGMSMLNVREIIIPASVEILETYAISGYKSCKKLVFAAGSKLREIKYGAFDRYLAESIIIPPNVQTIGKEVFYEWKNLKFIYVCSSTFIEESTDFWRGAPNNIKIYVTNIYQGSTFGGRPVEVIDHCGYFSDNYNNICSCIYRGKMKNNLIFFI